VGFLHNQLTGTAANGQDIVFAWLEDMISLGFRVLGSGNTVDYENDGQTSGLTGTGSGGGFHVITTATQQGLYVTDTKVSWVRMATPIDAPFYRELLVYQDYYTLRTDGHWRIERGTSSSSKFDTGGSASVPPSQPDYAYAFGHPYPTRSNSSLDFYGLFPDVAGSCWFHWAIGDANENYDWVVHSWRGRGTPGIFSMWGQVQTQRFDGQVLTGEGPDLPDPDPIVYIHKPTAVDAEPGINASARLLQNIAGSDTAVEDVAVGSELGCFAYLYGVAGNANNGFYNVGLCVPGGYSSSTFQNAITFYQPGYDIGEAGPQVIGPPLVLKGDATRYYSFCKGLYTGSLLKVGPPAFPSPGTPVVHVLRPLNGGNWYANFGGICVAWPSNQGLAG